LERSVMVIEAFRSVSSCTSQVIVSLKLPVCPWCHHFITDVRNLGNFSYTVISVKAWTKLRDS
jgi:hypothetical protein